MCGCFFFLMIRRPPRSTQSRSSAASDVYKRQAQNGLVDDDKDDPEMKRTVRVPRFDKKFIVGFKNLNDDPYFPDRVVYSKDVFNDQTKQMVPHAVSYTHLRAHETPEHLVCRLLLEKKKKKTT